MDKVDIVKIPDKCWGFMYVRPRAEKKIRERLGNMGITCYLPTVPHAYMMHQTKVITDVPMFPSYLFVCLDRMGATDLRYAEKRIIKIDLQLTPLREEVLIRELKALQQCEELARHEKILVNPGIRPGDKVRIMEGSLKGLETDVVSRDDDHNSIIVNITMLDQHVEYPVSAEQLRKITE